MEAMDGKEPVSLALVLAYDGTFCTWTRFQSEFHRTSLVCLSSAVRERRVLVAFIRKKQKNKTGGVFCFFLFWCFGPKKLNFASEIKGMVAATL